jgi:gliding motility-associated protein GldL
LNAVYELQLQDSNEHLKQTSKFYEGINEMMANLNSSLDDTKKYRQEVATLAKNLSQLNTVYGNMLSAMTLKS